MGLTGAECKFICSHNFLQAPGPSNSFTWPKNQDVCWVPYMSAIFKTRPPTTSTVCTYYLEREDSEIISKLLY